MPMITAPPESTCSLCKEGKAVAVRQLVGKFDGHGLVGEYSLFKECDKNVSQDKAAGEEESKGKGTETSEEGSAGDFEGTRMLARSVPNKEWRETVQDLRLSRNVGYWIGKYEESQHELQKQSMRPSGGMIGAGSTVNQGPNIDGRAVSAGLAAATAVVGLLSLAASVISELTPLAVVGIAVSIGSVTYYKMTEGQEESQSQQNVLFRD